MIDKPFVIEIKGNSLDDGPGVRSTIFFKGCPLSCIWCHNPESKKVTNELSWDKKTCIGDGGCIKVCENNALGPQYPNFVDRDKCVMCFKCADFCPAKALTKVGSNWEIEDLIKKVASDKPFYDISGGGVTISGGEATMFPVWMGKLVKGLKELNINVLMETCGYFDFELVKENILPYIHDIYCDIKIYDRENHKKYCGVYNDRILDNFKKMFELKDEFGYDILPRIPLIPNITDTEKNLTEIADYLCSIGCFKVELLPYNPTWYPKTDKIGVELNDELKGLDHFQSKDQITAFKEIFLQRGISPV